MGKNITVTRTQTYLNNKNYTKDFKINKLQLSPAHNVAPPPNINLAIRRHGSRIRDQPKDTWWSNKKIDIFELSLNRIENPSMNVDL